jgi:3-oxoacyl-[acyl-carrier protein] reductase
MSLPYKRALIIGGSRGVGRCLALDLTNKGLQVFVTARGEADLKSLEKRNPAIKTIIADASSDGTATTLLSDIKPDLVILAGGYQPKMGPVHEMDWVEFSSTWNIDTKIAFEFTKAALEHPLSPGSAIVSFSSGAAIGGSPLSGGYAGAKRMQHYLVNYGQREADRFGLDIQFLCMIPKQLIAGTEIGVAASTAYAQSAGIDAEQFMSQWEAPLTTDGTSRHVIDLLHKSVDNTDRVFAITGTGIEAMT